MTDTPTLPAWCTVGAPVVELTEVHHGSDRCHLVGKTIKSIGKRDIVLDDGSRYNYGKRPQLYRRNGDWNPSTYLLAPDDPRVIAARKANRRAQLNAGVDARYDDFRRVRTVENADKLRNALGEWLGSRS